LSALIILAFVQRELRGLKGVLNTKPLVLLGLWSYGFYLIHHSISRLATYEWGRMPDNNAVLFTLLGMALVVAAMSWALFTFVEEPAEKWWRKHTPKRWLPKKEGQAVIPPDPIELEPIEKEPRPATATATV
jgi:peptidoglycan/LPS O-acetylase OafA/YrhL